MTHSSSFRKWLRPLCRCFATLTLVGGAVPGAAHGQGPECAEGVISGIFVDNHSVFDLADPGLDRRFDRAYNLANRLHPATRQEVIRRELLFAPGDCYDIAVLRDSERLVRALRFIAAVEIYGIRQPDGTMHVVVNTRDEWSLRVEPQIGGGDSNGLTGARVGDDNFLGSGTHLSAFYLNDREKQVYGATYFTPQFLGSRWDAQLDLGRTPVGSMLNQTLSYPFVGETGRWAFLQSVRRHDRYFEYLVAGEGEGELVPVWYPERRTSADIGMALRLGHDGYNRTVVGAALAGEWVGYPQDSNLRYADPEYSDSLPDVSAFRRDTLESVRALIMAGQRNVHFVRGDRLNTVNGTEDVRLGVETEIALGPSIPGLTHRQDLALDLVLSAGGELPSSGLIGGQILLEARRDYRGQEDESEWRDVFGQVNLWAYLRGGPRARAVLVAAVNASGGWHTAVPFQLTLGRDAGLRGYRAHVYPGGRRIVATLEERVYLGWPFPDLFDAGAVVFVDAGRIWAGTAPFGMTSPILANAGVGLRLAFPPGSRQSLRIDLGVPIGPHRGGYRPVLSIGVGQAVGFRVVHRDPQIVRSARQGVSPSIFVLPARQ